MTIVVYVGHRHTVNFFQSRSHRMADPIATCRVRRCFKPVEVRGVGFFGDHDIRPTITINIADFNHLDLVHRSPDDMLHPAGGIGPRIGPPVQRSTGAAGGSASGSDVWMTVPIDVTDAQALLFVGSGTRDFGDGPRPAIGIRWNLQDIYAITFLQDNVRIGIIRYQMIYQFCG